METSLNHHATSPHSSNSSSSSTSTTTTTASQPQPQQPLNQPPISPKPIARSEPASPYPTTFVQADTSSFKQVVQMLTGSSSSTTKTRPDPNPTPTPTPTQPHKIHNIPPIKSHPKKSGSGFKLYERRNSLKHLNINPLTPFSGQPGLRTPDLVSPPVILSPSILDFPSLVLSPVTPLSPDPFTRPASTGSNYASDESNPSPNFDLGMEERAIREKGFFLHPSPSTTPRDAERPRLLPLFPTTSPRVSGANFSN